MNFDEAPVAQTQTGSRFLILLNHSQPVSAILNHSDHPHQRRLALPRLFGVAVGRFDSDDVVSRHVASGK